MPRPKILDEFTDLPISHQRKCQLRYHRDGKCCICGKPLFSANRCEKHHKDNYERIRVRQKSRTRYKHSKFHPPLYNLGGSIRVMREERGISRSLMQAMTGLSPGGLSVLEYSKSLTYLTLQKVAIALACQPSDILRFHESRMAAKSSPLVQP